MIASEMQGHDFTLKEHNFFAKPNSALYVKWDPLLCMGGPNTNTRRGYRIFQGVGQKSSVW